MQTNSDKRWWQISISGNSTNYVNIINVYTDEPGIKDMLVNLVQKDKNNDPDSWEWGTDSTGNIKAVPDGSFYAYGVYKMYRANYQAHPIFDDIIDAISDSSQKMRAKIQNDFCEWIKYDYRYLVPKYHDAENPYWRIPENTDKLKYCPYCGKEIKIVS